MAQVIDDLIAADDSEMQVMSMLRGDDLQEALVDESALPGQVRDRLAGPFAHIVVDEAQELTDAQWAMLTRRCPSRSLTIVGDPAQARRGFAESWSDRLTRVGLGKVDVATLRINYRTPAEVMAQAEPIIRAALPNANVPASIRETGIPVQHANAAELTAILSGWLADNAEGTACVVTTDAVDPKVVALSQRIHAMTPELVKGLEFDLVVLIDPDTFGDGVQGAVDRYVAMTRSTQQLVILTAA